jgi:hypothetical protein
MASTWGWTDAVLTRVVTTCKRLDIKPSAYLRDIFERISAHPVDPTRRVASDQWRTALRATADF